MKTSTLLIVTLKVTPDGIWNIPPSAWDAVGRIVTEDFGASMKVHDHDSAGAFHGFPDISWGPHYVLEIDVDEEKKAELMAEIMPLIDEIVKRYRREIPVPAGK
jgi:hypothetical protein